MVKFVYVPVLKTLQSMFKNKEVVQVFNKQVNTLRIFMKTFVMENTSKLIHKTNMHYSFSCTMMTLRPQITWDQKRAFINSVAFILFSGFFHQNVTLF